MEFINNVFGLDAHTLLLYQMLVRAATVFFVSLLFIRIAGVRTLSSHTTFDYISYVMLGSILGRAVVTGEQPFFPSLLAVLLIVLLQRFMSWITFKSQKVCDIVEGKAIVLIEEGEFIADNMAKTHLTEEDIREALHLILQSEKLGAIKNAYLERSGDISIVRYKEYADRN